MREKLTNVACLVFILNSSFLFSQHVVINEIYGGGGNSGATYKNDFIELYNPTASAIPLTGWSVQYAATGGTSWQKTDLPTPNVIAPGTGIAMAGGAGKVVLLNTNTLITSGTACPATRVDLVGYG